MGIFRDMNVEDNKRALVRFLRDTADEIEEKEFTTNPEIEDAVVRLTGILISNISSLYREDDNNCVLHVRDVRNNT